MVDDKRRFKRRRVARSCSSLALRPDFLSGHYCRIDDFGCAGQIWGRIIVPPGTIKRKRSTGGPATCISNPIVNVLLFVTISRLSNYLFLLFDFDKIVGF